MTGLAQGAIGGGQKISTAGPMSRRLTNPAAISASLFYGSGEPWAHTASEGRVFGNLPVRGEVVIVTPGQRGLYQRVIWVDGRYLQVVEGRGVINGTTVAGARPPVQVPIAPLRRAARILGHIVQSASGHPMPLPIVRETLQRGQLHTMNRPESRRQLWTV